MLQCVSSALTSALFSESCASGSVTDQQCFILPVTPVQEEEEEEEEQDPRRAHAPQTPLNLNHCSVSVVCCQLMLTTCRFLLYTFFTNQIINISCILLNLVNSFGKLNNINHLTNLNKF